MSERDIQRQAVKWLRKEGYDVLVTSNGRKTSNTRGTPDLFVWTDRWLALDTKQPGGKFSSDTQERLVREGKVVLYSSVEELIDICKQRNTQATSGNIPDVTA